MGGWPGGDRETERDTLAEEAAHSSWKTGFRAQMVAQRKSGREEEGGATGGGRRRLWLWL